MQVSGNKTVTLGLNLLSFLILVIFTSSISVVQPAQAQSCSTVTQTCSEGTDTGIEMEETGRNVCDMSSFEQDDECALDCQQTAKCSGYSNQCPGGGRVNYTDGNFVEDSCSWDGQISYYQCHCTLEVTETEEVSMEETGRNVCEMNDSQQNDECSTDCNVTQGYDDGNFIEDSCSWDGQISSYDCNCEKDRVEYTEAVQTNDPPTADDDGTVDAGICADSDGLVIDVLDNDGDDNGNDYDKSNIEITEITQEASKGAVQTFEDEGTDKISYTPNGDETGDDSFGYTVEFPDGTTDTATVTVDVTDGSCEGSITVEVEDQNGNPVGAESIEVKYDGDVKDLGSGLSGSTTVDLKDSGADAVIEKSNIDLPEEYEFVDGNNWVIKDEAVETYPEDWKSELGF